MTRDERAVAERHRGASYIDVLSRLSETTGVRRYIEVGVSQGGVFSRIACRHGIGVDPLFKLDRNVAANKQQVSLFQETSDAFFRKRRPRRILGGAADLVFLDGLHLFENLLRDFLHAEAVCGPDSIIALHDCLPLNAIMAGRDPDAAIRLSEGTPFPHWWTGDVWKLIPILREHRPDLRLILADAPPTGLVLVTGLDPKSRVLFGRYDAIVRDFADRPNDFEAIAQLHADGPIVLTDAALEALSGRRFAESRLRFLGRLGL